MFSTRSVLLVACALILCAAAARAADPAPEPKTLMTERGKLLFSDDLGGPLGKEWTVGKGKWEAADGAVKATELTDDKHAAVIRHKIEFHDAVIQYSFKLDGAKTTTLSINTAKAHLCRVVLTPAALTVKKDDADKDGPDMAVTFETRKTEIKPGEWHTLVVELRGTEMLASLDGKEVAFGSHEALDVAKANFGLTVAGESVSFKNLRVWEAGPAKDWEATKAKLLEARKTPAKPKEQ